MTLRVAKGTELPRDWRPGEPLTVGREAPIHASQPAACPFGPQCYSCRNGLQWDAVQGKHLVQHGALSRTANRRGSRSQTRSRSR